MVKTILLSKVVQEGDSVINTIEQKKFDLQSSQTVTVDFSTDLGTPSYRTSGFIYGLSEDGTQPPQNMQSDIKIKFIRASGAQLGCPAGGWANGGYKGFIRRWNSVKGYYRRCKAIGATFILLPHDLWGADLACDVPVWPGDNNDWTNFNNFVDQIIKNAEEAGMTGGDVQWDLWNEPDCCGFWEPHRSQHQYLEMWKRFYQKIRAAIPEALIVGPSTSGQPSAGWGWLNRFLDYVKQNNCIPDVISWHELNTESDPDTSKNNMDSLLSSRGILVQRAYQVNEYCTNTETVPGVSAWYIGRLERLGIDGLRANWGKDGELYDSMGHLVRNNTGKLGSWWIYKRYADMTGKLIMVTSQDSLIDGIAATDSKKSNAIIVLGSRGRSGKVRVNFTHLNNASYLAKTGSVNVIVEQMTDAIMSSPRVIQEQECMVRHHQFSITISWDDSDDGYVITLTPGSGSSMGPALEST